MPPCPSGEPEPDDPRPRPAHGRVPAERAQPMMQRARGRDRLALAAERGSRREVARQQPALAQRANRARVPPGQRAALGLHVAEPAPGAPCAKAHATGASCPCSASTATGRSTGRLQPLVLDRRDGVLQARVVELHHVARPGAPVAAQAAREVDVDDVKAARAQAEVERLHVDDHLVAHLARGPTSATSAIAGRVRDRPRSITSSCSGPSQGPRLETVARRSFSIVSATAQATRLPTLPVPEDSRRTFTRRRTHCSGRLASSCARAIISAATCPRCSGATIAGRPPPRAARSSLARATVARARRPARGSRRRRSRPRRAARRAGASPSATRDPAGPRAVVSARRSPAARSSAAAMKSRNSGAGRSGRDLNSGWNCEADEERVIVELDHLHQALVGRGAGHASGPRVCRRLRSRLLTS